LLFGSQTLLGQNLIYAKRAREHLDENGTSFCVRKDTFYEKLDALKSSKKKESKLTVFIDDQFCDKAKNWLKNDSKNEAEFGLSESSGQFKITTSCPNTDKL